MFENYASIYGKPSLTPSGSTKLLSTSPVGHAWRLGRCAFNVTMAKTGAIVTVDDNGTVLMQTQAAASAADNGVLGMHERDFAGLPLTTNKRLNLKITGASATVQGFAQAWQERITL